MAHVKYINEFPLAHIGSW